MLTDDELDFDGDFGDLGDLEAGGLTTEELEKELGLDLELDLEPIPEESLNSKKGSKEVATPEKVVAVPEDNKKDEKSKENIKQVEQDSKQEEQKKYTTKQETSSSPKKPELKQDQSKKYEKKPIPTTLDNQYNNNYNANRRYNNNQMGYYPMQQQQPMFYPQMQANFMAMNGMFPYSQQQPFANRNRIYVNPNFKGGNTQAVTQRQTSEAQKSNGTDQNDEQKAKEELLNKQRMEAAESLRKKLASKKQEGGIKRKLPDGPIEQSKRPSTESIQTKTAPSNGGFSILGAAKAKASAPIQSQQHQQQRVRSAVENNIKKLSTPSITSRLNRRDESSPIARPPMGRSAVQRPSLQQQQQQQQQASSLTIPKVPIVTNGKSNVVTITNLKQDVAYNQIKTIVDEIHATNNISYDKEGGSAIVTFPTIEFAVNFRRKYNRTQMGESHINITFKK